MRPTKAILAVDNNPIYYPFWNTVSKYWSEIIDIEPVLIYVGKESPSVLNLSEKYGQVHHLNTKDLQFKTSTMSQVVRHFGATLYPDDVCILSDIDMLPLNKDYFVNQKEVLEFNDDGICFYSSDAPAEKRFPMCYISAKGSVFSEIIKSNYDDFKNEVGKWINYGFGWNTDEMVFYDKWSKSKFTNNSLMLNRGWKNNIASNRIDRVVLGLVDWNRIGEYYDFHMLRPFKNNELILNKINSHFGV